MTGYQKLKQENEKLKTCLYAMIYANKNGNTEEAKKEWTYILYCIKEGKEAYEAFKKKD